MTGSLLTLKRPPKTQELAEFERDPDAALLSLATDDGDNIHGNRK